MLQSITPTPETTALLSAATKCGVIPAAYDDTRYTRVNSRIGNKRIGYAVRVEVIEQRPGAALVMVRYVEGTRYGMSTTAREYYIVARWGRRNGIHVRKAPITRTARLVNRGCALEVLLDGDRPPVEPVSVRSGYKVVVDAGGTYRSLYDDSEWAVGRCRVEAATDDHCGGYYYYRTLAEALAAAGTRALPAPDSTGRLAIMSVEASGREYRHHGGKLCTTRLRPTAVVAYMI